MGAAPSAVIWNLQQLAGTLTHFAGQQDLAAILQRYRPRLEQEICERHDPAVSASRRPKTTTASLIWIKPNGILTRYFEWACAQLGPTFRALFGLGTAVGQTDRQRCPGIVKGSTLFKRAARGRGKGNHVRYRKNTDAPSGNL